MSLGKKRWLIATLLSSAVLLSGCDTIRQATGAAKSSPDEFAVVTKAPLILPPNYNLRPPQPGAAPINQKSPTEAAQVALYGADTATVAQAMGDSFSPGEQLLLAHAKVQYANPSIREQLDSDEEGMQGADDSFTSDLLFWSEPEVDQGKPVDADAEAARLESSQANAGSTSNTVSTPGSTSSAAPAPAPSEPESEDDSGWFDWVDGIF